MTSLCLPEWTENIQGIKFNSLQYLQGMPQAGYNSVTKLQHDLYQAVRQSSFLKPKAFHIDSANSKANGSEHPARRYLGCCIINSYIRYYRTDMRRNKQTFYTVSLHQRCTNPGHQVAVTTKILTAAPNIFGPWVWHHLVNRLAPQILSWRL